MNDKVNDTKVIIQNIIDAINADEMNAHGMNSSAPQNGMNEQLSRAIALYCNIEPRSAEFAELYQEFKHYFQKLMMSGDIAFIPSAALTSQIALIAHKYMMAFPIVELSLQFFKEKNIDDHVQYLLSCYQILISHRDINSTLTSNPSSVPANRSGSSINVILAPLAQYTDHADGISKQSTSSEIQSLLNLSADDLIPMLTTLIEMGITNHFSKRPNLPKQFLKTYGNSLQFQSNENEMLRRLARLWLSMTYSPLTGSLGELNYAIMIISSCIYPTVGQFDRTIFAKSDRISRDEIEFIKGIISHIAVVNRNNFKPIQQLSDNIINNPNMSDADKYTLLSHVLFCATKDEQVLNKAMINSMLLGMRFISKDLLFFIHLIQLRDDITTSTKIDLCNFIIRFAKRDLSDRDNRSTNKSEYRIHQNHYQEAISIYKFYYFQNALSITTERFSLLVQSLDMKNDAHSLEEKSVVMNIQHIFLKHAQAVLSALKSETINPQFITNCLHDINSIIIEHVKKLIPSYRQQNIKTILFKLTNMLDHVVYEDDAIEELGRLIAFLTPEEFDSHTDPSLAQNNQVNHIKNDEVLLYGHTTTESQDGAHGGRNTSI